MWNESDMNLCGSSLIGEAGLCVKMCSGISSVNAGGRSSGLVSSASVVALPGAMPVEHK